MSRRLPFPRLSRPAYLVTGAILVFLLHTLFIRSSESPSSPISPGRTLSRLSSPLLPLRGSFSPDTSALLPGHERSYDVDIAPSGLTSFHPGDTKHPIELLIERAKRQADSIDAQIEEVTSLEDSVDEYERGYGMKPPKGFDRWYAFTRRGPVPKPPAVAPLLSAAHNPVVQFLSHPAAVLRERVKEEGKQAQMFSLELVPDGQGDPGTACTADQEWTTRDWRTRGKGMVKVHGDGGWKFRCNNTLSLLLPIFPLMPKEMFHLDPPLEILFAVDDAPRGMVHHSFRERGEALGRAMKLWPATALHKAEQAMRWTYGWVWACPDDAPLRTQSTDTVLNDMRPAQMPAGVEQLVQPKTFIADFVKSADVCYNPELMSMNRAARELGLSLATCRYVHSSDLVSAPLDGVWEKVAYIPWEEKPIRKAFWRGTATGSFHNKKIPWRGSQRERLHFLAHNNSEATAPILVKRDGRWVTESYPVQEMNEAWLDVGLSDGPTQCSEEDGSCDELEMEIDFMPRVRKEDAVKYKYVIDVDGNGWSSRFRRLLAGNNVVLKSTVFPEWFNDLMIPWYHYVPVKIDYSDLYDILAFFNGPPDGSAPGRDDLAKQIAEQGYRFTQEKWRYV
ncbi:hypothetical protein M231_06275 [Tremella mesenterica]|uniref:Glycosyl transferase CAP10 domain-containing protein n=1 Tax=Tremella mesenterica TaxID=5217 RepID=A0A4Q1BGB7_TREME|nr:hypothetical protein M231_06275 [Tremella mesenterica]